MTSDVKRTAAPVQVRLEAGKTYRWCSCGKAGTLPFCDGTAAGHQSCEPVEFTAQKDETVNVCNCGETADPPYCDGSHNII